MLLSEDQRKNIVAYHAKFNEASASPFGPADEIGMLNLMTAETRRAALGDADAGKPFDLAVDYFMSMPVWTDLGDPGFQIWMSHTPAGNMIDNPLDVSAEQNELVSYSGECISLYTHCGTHVDTFATSGCTARSSTASTPRSTWAAGTGTAVALTSSLRCSRAA
jgi:hypothetical protein